jgi:DNA-binding NarL/FixJ family response regulator
MAEPIRIVLADDHPLFRDGIKQILEFEPDLRIVGEAGDGSGAVEAVQRERPAILLLDVEMPGMHVTDTARRIKQISPDTRIIVLSMHDDAELVNRLVALGVCGYLLKTVTRMELLSAIRSTASRSDQVILSVSRGTLMKKETSTSDTLSSREKEVLELTAQAMSNSQIAARLNISEATVKRHLYNVFSKLSAVSRIDAVNKYYNRSSN